MNCQVVQNKILALADPRLVPDPLREHIAGCAGCRAWAQQAARLEALVEQLPAPAAPMDKKAALVGKLTRGEPIITRPVARPAAPRESRFVEFLKRNAVVIGGLAAAVLVALGAWAFFPRNGTTPALAAMPDDPFLKKMVERDLALAKADTPAKRLQVLSGMADDLSVQARGLARVASPDELRDLARWYDRVVMDAIVKQAERMHGVTLTPADARARGEVLNALTKQLGDTAAETDKLLGTVPPEAKPALQKIADAARDGQKKIEAQRKIELTEMRGKGK
jgi:hypothetical protein